MYASSQYDIGGAECAQKIHRACIIQKYGHEDGHKSTNHVALNRTLDPVSCS